MHTWSHAFLGCNVWGAQALTSVTANAGGGTFAAGPQSYVVTAATAYGESEPSTAQTVTLAADGSATLTWPEASNGTGDTGNPGPSLAAGAGHPRRWHRVLGLQRLPARTRTRHLRPGRPGARGVRRDRGHHLQLHRHRDHRPARHPIPARPTPPRPTRASAAPTPAGSAPPTIEQEIGLDQAFAAANGLTDLPAAQYTQDALVTGEHSGVENPNMPTALNAVGVTTFAQDASRQPTQYSLGNAIGAPRYPSNIYYNAANWTDQLNEYNTLYVKPGAGNPRRRLGRCVDTSSTTCRDHSGHQG